MNTRREFLINASLLSGGAAMINTLPQVIQRALAINPIEGSNFYDAEHIVFLMQENRSFDHVYGSLQGVRGYNDPRAIQLGNKNKVWLQSKKDGSTYLPFRLNIKNTKAPWMGSLPHGWADQTDARNHGKYDRWLEVKKASRKAYTDMPLTMGYCNREDFPFYYSLADAFTVCDQHFCSSITGTHPNRHYWMSGTIREANEPSAKAHVWNVTNYAKPELNWKTYPERLEENGVSWKVYQNEITAGNSLKGEADNWLGNFGTNVLEYYKQYRVKLFPGSVSNLAAKKENILREIEILEKESTSGTPSTRLVAAKKLLANIEADQQIFTAEMHNGLSSFEKNINGRAFSTNSGDPQYHELTELTFNDQGAERKIVIPKGDILHQFREDVKNGQLPTVSWLMPPANFSDHPSLPWFGPWYVSEIMDILLQNPEVWKKTIFILTYDENDGYFDHVPPFVVPDPHRENSGKVSEGIDPKMDFVTREQQTNPSATVSNIRESTIGLGYRVPLVIASPWTRGGFVCSEVFDHTSSLQFLENFLEKKTGKSIKEENITAWRRTICGDLTSAFRTYQGEKIVPPELISKAPFIESIYQSKFHELPDNYKKLSDAEIEQINKDHSRSPYFPQQEKGIRSSCALPYELYVNGKFNKAVDNFEIAFTAGKNVFGSGAAGAPFCVYAIHPYQKEILANRNYTAKAGDTLRDEWQVKDFDNQQYHLRVYGPNGFYREFAGNRKNPLLVITCTYEKTALNSNKLTGNAVISIVNNDSMAHTVMVKDNSYKAATQNKTIAAKGTASLTLNLSSSHHWYDVSVSVKGNAVFEERFAGRVETGKHSKTDPLMGGVV